jgi:hypothetical protein
MSRSRRKNPICAITTATTERLGKQCWHRAFRKAVRQHIAIDLDSEIPHLREFFNTWTMEKDGKRYWGARHAKADWLRK